MRKVCYSLVVIMSLLLTGCRHEGNSQLYVLEHFIKTNPDSTYSVLQSLKEESEEYDEADRMRYGLMRLQCQNSLGLQFDCKDSINAVVDYFAEHGTYSQSLLATYLMGRACKVAGDEPVAVEWFNKCLSLKASSDSETDYILLSKVHSQLDEIYGDQNLVQFELNELAEAEKCAKLGHDTLLAITYEYLRVNPYYKLGQHDSIFNITSRAREKYLALGMGEKAAEALYMLIEIYLMRGETTRAGQCINVFESESGVFDPDGNIESGREIYYYLKGRYHEMCGHRDSAEYQYRRLLGYSNDVNNTEAAYKGLLSIYRTVGNVDSIGKYADLYCEANDSIHAQNLSQDISRLKAMYDYSEYKSKSEEMKLYVEKTKNKSRTIVFIIAFVLLAGVYAGFAYRRRKQTEINNLLEEYDRTIQIIDALNSDKEEMLRNHQQELNSIMNSLQSKGIDCPESTDGPAIRDEVLSRFKDFCDARPSERMPVSPEDWYRLSQDMSNSDSEFMLFLSKSKLSDNEKRVAILIRLRFTDYQIKCIFDSYGSSLSNYKARINKKLFNGNNARTLRRHIYAWK